MGASRGGKGQIGLREVAELAAVSVKTASLALRASPLVASETARRVQEAARDLGYAPHLDQGRTVGVTVPTLRHVTYYADLVSAIRERLFDHDLIPVIGETGGNHEVERRWVSEMRRRRVDGLILVSSRLPVREINRIARARVPVAAVSSSSDGDEPAQYGSVGVANEVGAIEAVGHLVAHGRRRIAYLAGRVSSASDQQRRAGYREALRRAHIGADDHLLVEMGQHDWPTFAAGYSQCRRLLRREVPVDAIFAYNDLIALGAISYLVRRRTRVPDEISIVGFDNLEASEYSTPPLTSVGVDLMDIASRVVDMLVATLSHGGRENSALVDTVTPFLTIRNSVRRPPERAIDSYGDESVSP